MKSGKQLSFPLITALWQLVTIAMANVSYAECRELALPGICAGKCGWECTIEEHDSTATLKCDGQAEPNDTEEEKKKKKIAYDAFVSGVCGKAKEDLNRQSLSKDCCLKKGEPSHPLFCSAGEETAKSSSKCDSFSNQRGQQYIVVKCTTSKFHECEAVEMNAE